MKTSKVYYLNTMPSRLKIQTASESALVIYDKKLAKNPGFKKWVSSFNNYAVSAGEKLKDIDEFPYHCHKVLEKLESHNVKKISIVAVGGGSIGDFSGFIASVLKRGVGLIHVPSTWLAAIDSAHGGKTALNVGEYKNQIGSFYSADKVLIVKPLLRTQTKALAEDAKGELAKMAILDRAVFNSLILSNYDLWTTLPAAIKAKNRIVARDPFEHSAIRQALNLGHTFGHAIEMIESLSHGKAVAQGLIFSLEWSLQRGYITSAMFNKIYNKILTPLNIKKGKFFKLKKKKIINSISKDKKVISSTMVSFVFIRGIGKVSVEPVKVQELITRLKHFDWIQ